MGRVSGITNSKFDLRIQEPSCYDGRHKLERLDYFVADASTQSDHFILSTTPMANQPNPSVWRADVVFPPYFKRSPVILPQLVIPEGMPILPPSPGNKKGQLQRGFDFVSLRLEKSDVSGFSIYMMHGEKKALYAPPADATNIPHATLAWIAFRQTDGVEEMGTVLGKQRFIVRRFDNSDTTLNKKQRGVNHKWQTYPFGATLNNPIVLAFPQSARGPHAVTTRIRNITPTSVDVKLHENKKGCKYDGKHLQEDLGIVVIENMAAPAR